MSEPIYKESSPKEAEALIITIDKESLARDTARVVNGIVDSVCNKHTCKDIGPRGKGHVKAAMEYIRSKFKGKELKENIRKILEKDYAGKELEARVNEVYKILKGIKPDKLITMDKYYESILGRYNTKRPVWYVKVGTDIAKSEAIANANPIQIDLTEDINTIVSRATPKVLDETTKYISQGHSRSSKNLKELLSQAYQNGKRLIEYELKRIGYKPNRDKEIYAYAYANWNKTFEKIRSLINSANNKNINEVLMTTMEQIQQTSKGNFDEDYKRGIKLIDIQLKNKGYDKKKDSSIYNTTYNRLYYMLYAGKTIENAKKTVTKVVKGYLSSDDAEKPLKARVVRLSYGRKMDVENDEKAKKIEQQIENAYMKWAHGKTEEEKREGFKELQKLGAFSKKFKQLTRYQIYARELIMKHLIEDLKRTGKIEGMRESDVKTLMDLEFNADGHYGIKERRAAILLQKIMKRRGVDLKEYGVDGFFGKITLAGAQDIIKDIKGVEDLKEEHKEEIAKEEPKAKPKEIAKEEVAKEATQSKKKIVKRKTITKEEIKHGTQRAKEISERVIKKNIQNVRIYEAISKLQSESIKADRSTNQETGGVSPTFTEYVSNERMARVALSLKLGNPTKEELDRAIRILKEIGKAIKEGKIKPVKGGTGYLEIKPSQIREIIQRDSEKNHESLAEK